jgi:hypothetical protein
MPTGPNSDAGSRREATSAAPGSACGRHRRACRPSSDPQATLRSFDGRGEPRPSCERRQRHALRPDDANRVGDRGDSVHTLPFPERARRIGVELRDGLLRPLPARMAATLCPESNDAGRDGFSQRPLSGQKARRPRTEDRAWGCDSAPGDGHGWSREDPRDRSCTPRPGSSAHTRRGGDSNP